MLPLTAAPLSGSLFDSWESIFSVCLSLTRLFGVLLCGVDEEVAVVVVVLVVQILVSLSELSSTPSSCPICCFPKDLLNIGKAICHVTEEKHRTLEINVSKRFTDVLMSVF